MSDPGKDQHIKIVVPNRGPIQIGGSGRFNRPTVQCSCGGSWPCSKGDPGKDEAALTADERLSLELAALPRPERAGRIAYALRKAREEGETREAELVAEVERLGFDLGCIFAAVTPFADDVLPHSAARVVETWKAKCQSHEDSKQDNLHNFDAKEAAEAALAEAELQIKFHVELGNQRATALAEAQEQLSEVVTSETVDKQEWRDAGIPIMRGSPNLPEFIAFLHNSAAGAQKRVERLEKARVLLIEICGRYPQRQAMLPFISEARRYLLAPENEEGKA